MFLHLLDLARVQVFDSKRDFEVRLHSQIHDNPRENSEAGESK
jgi:hypothetical protein